MIQKEFAQRTIDIVNDDDNVLGLAVGGSWLTNEMDEFSDLDLVIVTKDKIGGDKLRMLDYANRFGQLLSGFTGEHVGEPRVLICLYNEPLLHIDLKFVTLEEFKERIETPAILLDKKGQLQEVFEHTAPEFPYPDYQWIEDRFWIWVHYVLLKIGRGEYLEAYDFFGFLRMAVFGPLLHIKNNHLPRGVRKVETGLPGEDLQSLLRTIPLYERPALLLSLRNSIELYQQLRQVLYNNKVALQQETERQVMLYFYEIENRSE